MAALLRLPSRKPQASFWDTHVKCSKWGQQGKQIKTRRTNRRPEGGARRELEISLEIVGKAARDPFRAPRWDQRTSINWSRRLGHEDHGRLRANSFENPSTPTAWPCSKSGRDVKALGFPPDPEEKPLRLEVPRVPSGRLVCSAHVAGLSLRPQQDRGACIPNAAHGTPVEAGRRPGRWGHGQYCKPTLTSSGRHGQRRYVALTRKSETETEPREKTRCDRWADGDVAGVGAFARGSGRPGSPHRRPLRRLKAALRASASQSRSAVTQRTYSHILPWRCHVWARNDPERLRLSTSLTVSDSRFRSHTQGLTLRGT